MHQGETCIVSPGCLLSGRLYNARGEAGIDGRLRLHAAVEFDRLMRGDAGFHNFVRAQVGERMAALIQRVDALAFQRFDQRLASHLLSGPARWHCTHQDLADELGRAPEIVSRAQGSFTAAGGVHLARGRIDIVDAEALARLAANPQWESHGQRLRCGGCRPPADPAATCWDTAMKINMGGIDRGLRLALGLARVPIVPVGPQTPRGWPVLVPLLTAAVSFCPLYPLLGLNTRAARADWPPAGPCPGQRYAPARSAARRASVSAGLRRK